MRASYTKKFNKMLRKAPATIQSTFEKQISLLIDHGPSYPSLDVKKYDEMNNVWQGRVNYKWRFYFTMQGDTYTLLMIISHRK